MAGSVFAVTAEPPNYMAVRIDGDTGLSWLDSAIFRISENKEKESTEGSAIH